MLAVLAMLVAPGCGLAPARDDVELTVWSMWSGQEERNFQRVLDRYEAEHPGIRIHNLGAVNDDTKTIRALVAGTPPDLFTLSDPSYLGPLARNRAIRPLDGLFRRSGLRAADFVPASLDLCRYAGRLYGMPFLIDDYALMWSKQAFRSAGLRPDRPPSTMEQLADLAARLTLRDANGRIARLGLRPVGDPSLLIALFGGRLVDPVTGAVTADFPANIAALAWYKNLIDREGGIDAVNAFTAGFGHDATPNNPFYVGQVAMMLNGEWNPYGVARYAPGMDYGVAPAPAPAARPDLARSTWIGGNVFCIPVDSKHPQQAWNLLVWMQSREAQVMFAHDMNNVPNIRSVLHAPELRTGAAFRRKFAVYLDLAESPHGAYFPALPVANFYINQLGTATDRILYGEKSPAQALREVRERVQRELDHQ